MTSMFATVRALFGAALLCCALSAAPSAFADGRDTLGPDVAAPPVRAAPIPPAQPAGTAPVGRQGAISIGNDLTLNVPAGYRYYSAEEAMAFLQRNGASTPSGTVLGLLAPAGANITAPDAWATVISYDAIGYVPGDTASGLTEPNLEADVRTARASQQRPFEGFAAQPAFDAAGAGLAWGERTSAPGAGGRDLRYEQRQLGRNGVAGFTSIGSADQMGAMVAAAPAMLTMVAFPEGQRYADHVDADQVSNYTVPGLVTGLPKTDNLVADAASAGGPVAGSETRGNGLQGLFPWIAGGVVALAALGYLALGRKKKDENLEPEEEA